MNKVQKWIANAIGIKRQIPVYMPMLQPQRIGTNLVWLQDNLETYVSDGYCANDIVYSIINIATEKARIAPWNAYKIKDESSLKLYKAEFLKKDIDIKHALDLRTKALELYTGDDKLNQLLEWPNEHQTFSDLVADSMIHRMLTGNRYIYSATLDMGANKGKPEELHVLPSQYMQIFATNTFPNRVAGYQLSCGVPMPIPKEAVMHDRMPNPNYDMYGSQLYGMAPLRAMIYNLTRSKYAKQASTYSFVNLGPDVIIFVDDDRLTADQSYDQASAIKTRLYDEYSGVENRKKTVVSGYKMGAEKLGLSPVDLDILNAEKWDVIMIANGFNFPHIILFQDASTYDNMRGAEKALTSRCVLPHHVSFRNNFNRKLKTDWGYRDKNLFIDFDMSVYNELNPDMVALTTWIMQSTHLTIRQKFQLQQIEVPEAYINDPMIDKIFIDAGKVPIEDYDLDRQMREVDENNLNENI